MFKDRFDKMLWSFLAATILALSLVLLQQQDSSGTGQAAASLDKSLEREMAYQARIGLLQKIYGPVETLTRAGDSQSALFKLDELTRQYPGEAHGRILRAEILQKMGAEDEALHSYVEGVRLNGDYLDRKSPLSRRAQIEQAADQGLKSIAERLKANPDNGSLVLALKEANYLRSRLAGGCE